MISVLLPSRGRPSDCEYAVHTIVARARPNVEILLRLDHDDPMLDAYKRRAGTWPGLHAIVGSRHGYTQLHGYYNDLAANARGDWLLLWNDDARMRTLGWDTELNRYNPSLPFVATPGGTDHPFPVISRAFYEALGHFSLSAHCDHWVCEIGKAAGCMVDLGPVQIDHLRDELDDETKREGVAAQENVTLAALETPELQALLAADIEKVRAAMAVAA